MRLRLAFAASIVIFAASAAAQPVPAPAQAASDAFRAGQDFANGAQGQRAATGAVNAATGATHVPRYNTNPPEAGIFNGGRTLIGGAGSSKQAECRDYQANNAYEQQECNAVNFLSGSQGQRPRFNLDSRTDPLIVNSRAPISQPGSDGRDGASACHMERHTVPGTFSQESCQEAQTTSEYSCNGVLTVTCASEADGCNPGGIVPGSTEGDMRVSFTPASAGDWALEFGTFANDYWSQCHTPVERSMTFVVRDMELITSFYLQTVSYDDYIMLKVNGRIVFTGPDGGNTLWVTNDQRGSRVCTNSAVDGLVGSGATMPDGCTGERPPERNTSWSSNPSLDLRPYLRSGQNRVEMAVVACGGGEGAIRMITRQRCPRICRDTWDNSQCTQFQERAQR